MSIYRRLVIEEPLLVGAVRDRHDVDILEFRTGFTPVTMGQDVVPADFAAGLDLAPGRHRPMKQSIETRDANAGLRWFHVFEKRGKAADNFARDAHGFGRISSGTNSRLRASKTFHSCSPRSTTSTRIIFAGSSAFSPGSMLFRRTWPTPSVKIPFAGMIRNFSAPTFWVSNSQCFCSENPRGTFNVVQSLYSEPALTVSVERMTT